MRSRAKHLAKRDELGARVEPLEHRLVDRHPPAEDGDPPARGTGGGVGIGAVVHPRPPRALLPLLGVRPRVAAAALDELVDLSR